jgi:hypothetical protein
MAVVDVSAKLTAANSHHGRTFGPSGKRLQNEKKPWIPGASREADDAVRTRDPELGRRSWLIK